MPKTYTFKVAAATMKGIGPYSPVLSIDPDPAMLDCLQSSLLLFDHSTFILYSSERFMLNKAGFLHFLFKHYFIIIHG
ncbi:unnamed protein product [Brugia pahangi]|uniref:Uncharacterized protein n=1 Tax=Brugia pahangi TaxID=6280 RepID=A0A0N4T7V0_BRUPA|nr:unnamed protein product [Brugia pahangi]